MQIISKDKALELLQRSIEEALVLPSHHTGSEVYNQWETWLRTLLARMRAIFAADSDQLNEIEKAVREIEQNTTDMSARTARKGQLLAVLRAYSTEIEELWSKDVIEPHEDSLQPVDLDSTPQSKTGISQHAADKPRSSIVVFTALYEELDRIFDDRATIRFPLQLDWSRHTLEGLKISYWYTQLGEHHDLIAVTPDSMGLTETSIVVTATFQKFNPVLTAMLGVCAGRYDKGVRLGHIIVPTQAFHYQFGARTENELKPEIRAESVDPSFYTAAQRVKGHEYFEVWMNEQHPASLRPAARCECHVGPMASSDYVAKWDELIEHAISMDRKVIGIDMESYAFLRSAKLCGLARESFIVKCVTDYADKNKDDQIREWAQVAAARFFYFMLVRWLDDTDRTSYWAEMTRS